MQFFKIHNLITTVQGSASRSGIIIQEKINIGSTCNYYCIIIYLHQNLVGSDITSEWSDLQNRSQNLYDSKILNDKIPCFPIQMYALCITIWELPLPGTRQSVLTSIQLAPKNLYSYSTE